MTDTELVQAAREAWQERDRAAAKMKTSTVASAIADHAAFEAAGARALAAMVALIKGATAG